MHQEIIKKNYIEDIKRLQKSLPNNIKLSRENALKIFLNKNLPNKKDEQWLYTNIHNLLPERISVIEPIHTESNIEIPYKFKTKNKLILINGHYQKNLSNIPSNINISINYKEIVDNNYDTLSSLNLAISRETISINIPNDQTIEDPLCIYHVITKDSSNRNVSPRIFVKLGENSKLTLIELFQSLDQSNYWCNSYLSTTIEANGKMKYINNQLNNKNSLHTMKYIGNLKKDSNLESTFISIGAKSHRNNIEINMLDDNANVDIQGISIINDDQQCDNFINLNHKKPNTLSNQLFKSILSDKSHFIFTGNINIGYNSHNVKANQLNKNIILGEKAHVNIRPQLQIYNDNVECTHGATSGQINEEDIFYMQSRGISKKSSIKLLSHAHIYEVIENINNNTIENWIKNITLNKLDSMSKI